MDNKVLIILYVPLIAKKYEVLLPINKTVEEIIFLLNKSIPDLSNGAYKRRGDELIYNRVSGEEYKRKLFIKDTNIRNGTEIIYI